MQELIAQPWFRYILIGVAVLFIAGKYLPLGSIFRSFSKKSDYNHTINNPKLIELVKHFKNKNFTAVTSLLENFDGSFRSFGLSAMGDVADSSISDQWLRDQPNNPVALLIKGEQLISQAWKVRGSGTIDTVSSDNLAKVDALLGEAKKVLLDVKKTSNPYHVNADASLLSLLKALKDDRKEIHDTFNNSFKDHPNDFALNISYFQCISTKWGGNSEEIDAYFEKMPDDELLKAIIMTTYYNDIAMFYLSSFSKEEKAEWQQKIRSFIYEVDASIGTPLDPYLYKLYWLLSQITHNIGGMDKLEAKYDGLVAPYYRV